MREPIKMVILIAVVLAVFALIAIMPIVVGAF